MGAREALQGLGRTRREPPHELRRLFVAAGADPERPFVATCGSGVTANSLIFAARLLGNRDTRLYDGSWSEWGADPATPVVGVDPDAVTRAIEDRGALLDLKKAEGLDTGKFEEDTLKAGEFDGGLYGLNAGINSFAIVANPAIFKAAGVALPDDTTWTWDDYTKLAAEATGYAVLSRRGYIVSVAASTFSAAAVRIHDGAGNPTCGG